MIPLLLDHLWQSTAVLAVIALLTLAVRNNGAHVRHALWTAASLKFLLPFALLNGLGHYLSTLLAAPPVQPPLVQATFAMSQPFSDGSAFVALPAPGSYLLPVTAIWGAGILAVAGFWLSRWLKLRATLGAARDADIAAPMPVKMSAALLEPGLVGIFRPVLLLPEGIAEKLSLAELGSIIAHEACHLRRRDNFFAALHMLVEAIFWFWPPVWWLGTRLIAEREKACDEAVLASGSDPQTYAESILKVCKHYVSSPLACAAGVSGANLKQRMEDIMKNTVTTGLNIPKKALLAASAAVALMLPLAAGIFTAPPVFAQTTSKHNFVGEIVYAQGNGDGGAASVLTLEAGKQDKSLGLWSSHVVMHFPYGMALADSAIYDFNMRSAAGGKTITLLGHVKLVTGKLDNINGLPGQRLVFDARTGSLNLDGKVMPSGMPKFVPCTMDCKFTER